MTGHVSISCVTVNKTEVITYTYAYATEKIYTCANSEKHVKTTILVVLIIIVNSLLCGNTKGASGNLCLGSETY